MCFFYQGRSLSLVLFCQQRLWARECVSFFPVHSWSNGASGTLPVNKLV